MKRRKKKLVHVTVSFLLNLAEYEEAESTIKETLESIGVDDPDVRGGGIDFLRQIIDGAEYETGSILAKVSRVPSTGLGERAADKIESDS